MLNLHKYWITGAIVGLTLPVISIYAADDSVPYAQGHWSGTATAGLIIWSDLKDLDPAAGGSFDSLGFVVELAGHKHVTRWGSPDVLIGADLGIFATQSDIPGNTEALRNTRFSICRSAYENTLRGSAAIASSRVNAWDASTTSFGTHRLTGTSLVLCLPVLVWISFSARVLD